MTTIGIICEYNPMHIGHVRHIEQTRHILGDCAVICVMSSNFVQRGDFAIYSKHARAEAAVRCGADLVIELPLPYALSSAEGFAQAGVFLLAKMGASYISFGSESGDITELCGAAETIASPDADAELKKWLGRGVAYASARQKAAEAVLADRAEILKTPNNLLGIEYIKAINTLGADIRPFTIKREGGNHDSDKGCSASALRKLLFGGTIPQHYMPDEAARIYAAETSSGRGPVSRESCETALLARLRAMTAEQFAALPLATEGLDRRIMRYSATEPTFDDILAKIKTKRYAMSRIRRMLYCAVLGITADDLQSPPPYIRVLAMNKTGMRLLKESECAHGLPVITKPASAMRLPEPARKLFNKEAAATDFYVLAYPGREQRTGGQEWTTSPRIIWQ